jgi:hypothetical protein
MRQYLGMTLNGTLKTTDEWSCNHFIHCILEGLRRAKLKPLNYSQVMAVQQGPLETPEAFLQRLEMLYKSIPALY